MESRRPAFLRTRVPVIIGLACWAVSFAVACGVVPFAKTHVLKTGVAAIALSVVGFMIGFRPLSQDRGTRNWEYLVLALLGLTTADSFATRIAQAVHHTYPSMLAPFFLTPFLLILGALVLGGVLGRCCFLRAHPDVAYCEDESQEISPGLSRQLLFAMALVFVAVVLVAMVILVSDCQK